MFTKTFPFMEKTLAKMERVVDLEKLAQKVSLFMFIDLIDKQVHQKYE